MPPPVKPSITAEEAFAAELAAIKAESIGWLPLGPRAYVHRGDTPEPHEDFVIEVVGIPDAQMAGMNVLLLL